jgi:aminoglycoside/choline kinase family phosphotransferase
MERQQQISTWLEQRWPGQPITLAPASADASFRRYFRATLVDGTRYIVMDAPPEREDCRPWLAVQQLFAAAGVPVPEVFAEDLERGFLLISDLGETPYLSVLTAETAPLLYSDAIDALIRIQLASQPGILPDYDEAALRRELELFPEWFVARHYAATLTDLERTRLAKVFDRLVAVNLAESKVFVHRDFHSRNLMVSAPPHSPGIIDFQDALYGPLSYDLVSLFKDAYIDWDEELVIDWLVRYWEQARKVGLPVRSDFAEFHRDFEWMGVQRHLKVLGIFARLAHRDGKTGYLKDMPRVAGYLRKTCGRYDVLAPVVHLLNRLEKLQVQEGYTF